MRERAGSSGEPAGAGCLRSAPDPATAAATIVDPALRTPLSPADSRTATIVDPAR